MAGAERWLQNHRETGLWADKHADAGWLGRAPQWSMVRQQGPQDGFRIPVRYFGSTLIPACDAWMDAVALGPIDQPAQIPPPDPGWMKPPGSGGKWLMNHRGTDLFSGPNGASAKLADVPQWSTFAQLGQQQGERFPVYYYGNGEARPGVVWVKALDLGPIEEPSKLPPFEPAPPRPTLSDLPDVGDFQFTFEQLWPHIEAAGAEYGADAQLLAALMFQESGFKNFLVHHDGTGHGLIGLDDNGLLPDFEQWSGMSVGRGHHARAIPPELQIAYVAKTIAALTRRHGNRFLAARVWHRGPTFFLDERGDNYERLMKAHIRRLFG